MDPSSEWVPSFFGLPKASLLLFDVAQLLDSFRDVVKVIEVLAGPIPEKGPRYSQTGTRKAQQCQQ